MATESGIAPSALRPGTYAPLTGGHRFSLTRYFAATSLICILIIASALGWIYQHLALRELAAQAEAHNAVLGQTLSNALWHRFDALVSRAPALDREAIVSSIETQRLREQVVALLAGSSVIKVKLYTTEGLTVFSTDASQIGAFAPDNPGVRAAAMGQIRSNLTHRNTFDGFEGTLQNLDVLATYRPAYDGAGKIRGVFEIYTDVSTLLKSTREVRKLVIGAVLALLALLYGLLHLLISRAQHLLDLQSGEISRALETAETQHRDLAQRYQARTAELVTANVSLQQEVADRISAESKLRLAAQVFENSVEGITITDPEQRILAVNRAFTVVTGYEEAEVIGKTPRLLQSGRQSPAFYEAMWEQLRAKGHWQGEIWNRRKNGQVFPEWLSVSAVKDSFGNVSNYVGVFSDISDIKDSQDRLDYLAHHDTVTGLPNRLLFNQHVTMAIDRSAGPDSRFALVFLDLDHFKHINESLGHEAGDALLRVIAGRFRHAVRTGDTLARLGGDEFITLIEHIHSGEDAAIVARQMLDTLTTEIAADGHELFVSASIGISVFPDDGEDVNTLVKHAEAAMYQAKSSGRNAYCFYHPGMSTGAAERLQIETQLRRAIDNGEMTLCFQPQIALDNGRLVGAEALVRWQHPERGLVPPPTFIPITEETGLINEIGAWALREACAQIARWDRQGYRLPRLAINVSVRQLEREGFFDVVRSAITDSGISPDRIEIELTESVLMQTTNAAELLERLRELGLMLSIDDFGTGYSSLSYLRRLPIDKLKIDRSFIGDITSNSNDVAIVESIVALARSMSLRTVAEGVESEDQAGILRRLGCDAVQGFLISAPLDADAFRQWSESRIPPETGVGDPGKA